MSKRILDNWLTSYLEYTSGTESPKHMHFYAGVSALAGALRRKVWIDQVRFCWYPSFYIVFVADPGIVTKSTTADLAMELLREVPGINFGPDNVTWQSLISSFAASCESYEWNGDFHPMSALTLVASEFGSLMDLHNQDMVNLFITLWDGRKRYEKQTKMSGHDTVEAPWINMLACTTPSWLNTNMDNLAMAGGLTSRTLYVFADKKENYVAYPRKVAPHSVQALREALVHDLEYIAVNLTGPFEITAEAEQWGEEWYRKIWEETYSNDLPDWHKGYLARKQTHMHKLAMILSVAESDSMTITKDHLILADTMLVTLEQDYEQVFAHIGRSDTAREAMKFVDMVRRRGAIPYEEAYKAMHAAFPDFRDFEGILSGAIRSGQVQLMQRGDRFVLAYVGA